MAAAASADGTIYHIFTKSIEGYRIFRNNADYERMRGLLSFYKIKNPPTRYSEFQSLKDKERFFMKYPLSKDLLVEIIAYCLMPTHLHLILSEQKKKGISLYMARILNSYTRYFNTKYKRKGPLWQGRFKKVPARTEEQLYHLTRYLHLNPTSDNLVSKPEDWKFSSYREFLGLIPDDKRICNFAGYLNIEKQSYRDFVLSRLDYQKEISKIKSLSLE